jgi:hypothetical protein
LVLTIVTKSVVSSKYSNFLLLKLDRLRVNTKNFNEDLGYGKATIGDIRNSDYPDNYGDLASWQADVGGN